MRYYKSVQCLLILFVLQFSTLCIYAQMQLLNLFEGDVCYKSYNVKLDHICRDYRKCSYLQQAIKEGKRPAVCSFNYDIPIICCPPDPSYSNNNPSSNGPSNNEMSNNKPSNNGPTNNRPPNNRPSNNSPNNTPSNNRPPNSTPPKPPISNPRPTYVTAKTYSAAEMCYEYSKLIYRHIPNPTLAISNNNKNSIIQVKDCVDVEPLIVGGEKAKSKEFPHMALIGYEEIVDNVWNCGGSVISKRWILTAAHCEKLQDNLARWARLGELNYATELDDTIQVDYKIEQRIIHPDYHYPSRYNDIALFGLEKDIEFSPYIRPICLHTEYKIQSSLTVATGWGLVGSGWGASEDLLKVTLDILPVKHCQTSYANVKRGLPRGIEDASMLCVGNLNGGKDTCSGDSGGPIQIKNNNYTCMYTQIGITSFGKECAIENTPAIYTRVSKYIPWIEEIVWPRN